MSRVREYGRVAAQVAAYGGLLAFWALFLGAFVSHVGPRLGYLAGKPIGFDAPCAKPECDFSVFWPAGILARAGEFATLYQAAPFIHAVNRILPSCPNIETFFYPPTMLPLLAAVSHLPFELAALLWMFGFWVLSAGLLRWAGFSWGVVVAGLLSPAALFSTEIAQFGTLAGALLLAGLMRQSGVLGLFVAKPQLGVLAPIALLVKRQWSGFAGFVGVALALVALSLLMFGSEAWRAYLTLGQAETARIMSEAYDVHTSQGWGVSFFWLLRGVGLSVKASMAVQAVITVACAGLLWGLRNRFQGFEFVAFVVLLSLLATPYDSTSDMVGYSVVLAENVRRKGWRVDMLDALLFLWPGLALVVSVATGYVLTPLVVVVALVKLWRDLPAKPA